MMIMRSVLSGDCPWEQWGQGEVNVLILSVCYIYVCYVHITCVAFYTIVHMCM